MRSAAQSPSRSWRHARGVLDLGRPRVMAIVNVTPDSFYDGGQLVSESARDNDNDQDAKPRIAAVLTRCRGYARAEAAILDVGGESTRPGARPVSEADERARVVPVIRALAGDAVAADLPISVDTRRAAVARAAASAGASIINDVSGLADPAMIDVVKETGCGLIIGHLRGQPSTMQDSIAFADVLADVAAELRRAVERAVAAGVERERIMVDPGIGFGKTARQSAALVAAGHALREATGCPVLIGASRKSFLGAITNRPVQDRLHASLAAAVIAVAHGADVVRVHDVEETVEVLEVAATIGEAYTELQARSQAARAAESRGAIG